MADRINKLTDRLFHKRGLKRWERQLCQAGDEDLSSLRALRVRTREARRRLDKILYVADSRLTLPLIGPNAIQKPLHCDWAYRP
ncbi:MAG: DUF6478 family protein, partial [Paracoccaceae bacterium]